MVRAKFRVQAKQEADGEGATFFKWTPGGVIELEYYVDFTAAE